MVVMEVYRKSQVADRSVSIPITLNDLERWDVNARGQISTRIARSCRLIQNGQIRQDNACGDKHISRGQPSPHLNAVGFQWSPILGVPFYLCIHCCRTTKFDAVTHGEGPCFYRSPLPHPKVAEPQHPPNFGVLLAAYTFVAEL